VKPQGVMFAFVCLFCPLAGLAYLIHHYWLQFNADLEAACRYIAENPKEIL